ncbi:MAG TPA: M23 family metallopeptidase [Oligoflexus sp.]|nr:M23 family metallopeptidase [Oligoflexus sp.]
MMFRAKLFLACLMCAACGSPHDSSHLVSKAGLSRTAKPKVILAYEIKRQPGETLRTVSQRFQVPLSLLEIFNPRGVQGRYKKIIYVPISHTAALKASTGKKALKIVKLMRDSFLRPIKIGDWSALEEEDFQKLDEWIQLDESQRLSFPVEGYISSGFSWRWNRFHKGLDIAARRGTPIVAAQDGKVVFRGWKSGFGLLVILEHVQGKTYYAHCQTAKVKVGQKVSRGDLIGLVGATGQSRGPHLHFEYRDNYNQPIDPTPFLLPPCSRPVTLSAQPGRVPPGLAAWSAKSSLCQTTDI